MTLRKISLGLSALFLAGCMSSAPYVENGGSTPVSQLKQTVTLDNGQTFRTHGFVEVFEPNYFVLVSAPDDRDLSKSRDSASAAARKAVENFDCSSGTTVKTGRKYSAEANQWLIIVDCRSGLL